MTGWSFQEVFLLVVIGLIVLGPKRLPQVANQLGTWLGQARRMTRMMKRQLEEEINLDLDQVNLHKQLGLDDSPAGRSSGSTQKKPAPAGGDVSTPTYVQDRARNDDTPGKTAAAETGPAEELPDDYSPAHGPGEIGTGVGEEATAADDERPTLAAADDERDSDAGNTADDEASDKKETA